MYIFIYVIIIIHFTLVTVNAYIGKGHLITYYKYEKYNTM